MSKLHKLLIVALVALTAACKSGINEKLKVADMTMRPLGKTGIMVGEIGLGCDGFGKNTPEFISHIFDIAQANGVNYVDLYTPEPAARDNMGYALKGRRESFIVQGHIGNFWKDGQYCRTRNLDEVKIGFEDLLTRLNTDYIDVGMIHIADDLDDWNLIKDGDVMKYAMELKKDGKIRHIGLSSHSPAVALAAVESGLIEVLMFSLNPAFDIQPANKNLGDLFKEGAFDGQFTNTDSVRAALYRTCQIKGVGLVVMKALSGGALIDPKQTPLDTVMTVNQCVHYALTRPGVSVVLSGDAGIEDINDLIQYENATEEQKDFASLLSSLKNVEYKEQCLYCGHCAPCPNGIDVAAVTRLLNIALAEGSVSKSVSDQYNALEHKASECTQCGDCLKNCPFAVDAPANMKKAQEIFGK